MMYKFSYFGIQSRLTLAARNYNENSEKVQEATKEKESTLQHCVSQANEEGFTVEESQDSELCCCPRGLYKEAGHEHQHAAL